MKAIGGINGPCKIVYDGWYTNRQKSVSFSGLITEKLSGIVPKLGSRGMENMVT